MQNLLRLTILGVFAAVGIGIAIAVALHLESAPESTDIAKVPASTGDVVATPVSAMDYGSAPDDIAVRFAGRKPNELAGDFASDNANPNNAASASSTPDPLPLQSVREAFEAPVARQLQQLEQTLIRVQEVTKQNQIERLEAKLDRLHESADESQRAIAQRLDSLQTRNDRESASSNAPVASVAVAPPAPTVSQQVAEDDQETPFGPESLPPARKPVPTLGAKIHKGEGDDQLTLNLRNEDLREVLDYLSAEGELNILATESVRGTVTASLTNVDINTALQAILQSTGYISRREGKFVYVGTPPDFQQMDFLRDTVETRIYRTNYVTAAEVQKLITPLLTPSIGLVTVSTPAQVDIASNTVKTGGDDFAGNEVVMVRDYASVLAHIDSVIADVDQCPQQVSIEAMILSVNLKDSNKLGVNFEVLRSKGTMRLASGSPLTNLAAVNVADGGLKFGFLDSNLAAFIDALESVGDTNVIASPRLMCLNKQRAEILIGDQKGYLSTTQTETATTQTVEFLDVGTQLRLRPYISRDGMIRMEIHPELSTGEVKLVGTFALPEKSTTQVTTNIMCHDGGTIVIGGLIREDLSTTASQLPVLGSIPVVGSLFRQKSESTSRSEIVVLLTPRIVKMPQVYAEGQLLNDEFKQRQAIYADHMSPIGRRHYGRRHLALARTAWNDGDSRTARRHADLAVHFDPLNLEAIEFRNELMAVDPAATRPLPSEHKPLLRYPGETRGRLDWPEPPPVESLPPLPEFLPYFAPPTPIVTKEQE